MELISGFLPYARTEGFVILAVILFFILFVKRDFKAFGFVLIGSLFFNTLGWIIEGKPFWIITENPYIKFQLSGENVCGSGSFFHYFRWGHATFGMLTMVLMAIGSIAIDPRNSATIWVIFERSSSGNK